MPDQVKSRFRIFCALKDAENYLDDSVKLVESYPAFVVVEATKTKIDSLKLPFPCEKLRAPKGPPSLPQTAGLSRSVGKQKSRGPYWVVVRFTSPVKKEWLNQLGTKTRKVKSLLSLGSNTLVVKCQTKTALNRLKKLEVVARVTNYVPHVDISKDFLKRLKSANKDLKLEEAKEKASRSTAQKGDVYLGGNISVTFFETEHQEKTFQFLKRNGVSDVHKVGYKSLTINLFAHKNPIKVLQSLIKRSGLRSLEQEKIKNLWNDVARNIVAGPIFNPAGNLGLTGAGEIIAIADTGIDTGEAATIHPDFRGRMLDIQSFPIVPGFNNWLNNPEGDDGPEDLDGHGTHVCGSAAGDGTRARELSLPPIEGVATQADIVFQAIEQTMDWNDDGQFQWLLAEREPPTRGLFGIPDDLRVLFQRAYDQGARIHSNSWGGGRPGDYDLQCFQLDDFVFNNPDLLVLVAAGNDGEEDGNGAIALQSVTSPGTAKNCLTVGASENERPEIDTTYRSFNYQRAPFRTDLVADNRDDIAAFSSRGPCTTGRRKPDVVAPGTFIQSNQSSRMAGNPQDYRFSSGTSMATPIVAGCAVLVRQYLRQQLDINNPSAALMKAALIHSAQYMPYRFAHPQSDRWADNEQGWGLVNLASLLLLNQNQMQFIDEEVGMSTGEAKSFTIQIPNNVTQLRITLCYSDFPGEELINNLNLFAFAPDNSFFNGNDFKGEGIVDNDNNVEGIIIENPIAGAWRIQVIASNVIEDVQPFALVISTDGEIQEEEEETEGTIYISAAQPNPEGGDAGNEWVEISNTGNTEVSLVGYSIEDKQRGSHALTETIQANGRLKVILPRNSRVKLANKGDEIILKKGENIIHQVSYTRAKSGEVKSFDRPGDV